MSNNKYTKGSIKARMYSRIATLWNIRNIDDLDPVVKLLVESLASEVFSLSGELDTIEQRIVEKLARAFTPSFMIAASPAHAILHGRSISETASIDTNNEFIYKDPRFIQRHNLRKLSFTPVCRTTAFDADTVNLIADGRFYNITPRGGREHIANSLKSDPAFNNTIWIGLDINNAVKDLKEMAFYFEFPFMDDCEEYLRLIEFGKWSCNGTEILTAHGLVSSNDNQDVYELYDRTLYLNNEIKAKYNKHFVTIIDHVDVKGLKKENIPHELLTLFDGEFVKELLKEIVWIKVVLPPAFNRNGLSNMAVHINCFPIANIYNKQIQNSVTPTSSIIRLEKDDSEYFLYVDSVEDSAGKEYKQVRTHEDNDARTYVIRRGGSERFNSLDAKDFLERLLDLYRDESIAFAGIDQDIAGTAENMMEYLSDFDRKLKLYDANTEHTSYIILGGDIKERAGITVNYYLTNGIIANGIKTSEILSVPETSDVVSSSTVLMTATAGGRKAPSESSQKEIYQYMLTSRDRVYTREDIKLFCRSHYGEYFKNVEVENSYEVSSKPKEGIIRITKVILNDVQTKAGIESGRLAGEILAGLQRRTPDGVNYRIILN